MTKTLAQLEPIYRLLMAEMEGDPCMDEWRADLEYFRALAKKGCRDARRMFLAELKSVSAYYAHTLKPACNHEEN